MQLRRDRLTFAMMLGVPVMQLLLFGYAINTDPRHLPTAVLVARRQPLSPARSSSALDNTGYFDFTAPGRAREAEADELLQQRRGAVRRHHPVRLHPPRGARRARRRS